MTLIIKAEEVWAKKDPLNWWAVSFLHIQMLENYDEAYRKNFGRF